MIRFLKRRAGSGALGYLEDAVMDIVWSSGKANVRDVAEKLARPLAYTTVMTTLDRLYKKGLLDRRKLERAFVYSPRLSREQWERERAGELVSGFLAHQSSDVLISCLVEAVGDFDRSLLDDLERKVLEKRRQLVEKEPERKKA
jgi:predicted transcriptional regulator